MPQRKTALKSLRQSKKKRQYNLVVKSKVKKAIKEYLKVLKENNEKQAVDLLRKAYTELDKAVSKKIIHKNKASRKKSRLSKKLKSVAKA